MPQMIGDIEFSKKEFSHGKIKQLLKLNSYNSIELGVGLSPLNICVLPNGKLLCSLLFNGVALLDNELKILKRSKILNKNVNIWSCATNNKNRIYLTDLRNNQIIMTDFNLNLIKNVGSKGDSYLQFHDLRLCYANEMVYVAELGNKRIQILNDDLDYITMHDLSYSPRDIKVINNTALIASLSPSCIYAYNIEGFKLKYLYRKHNGLISVINSVFYEYYPENQKYYCYNEDGQLVDEIETKGINGQLKENYDGSLQIFNNSIICSSYSSQRLVIIKNQGENDIQIN